MTILNWSFPRKDITRKAQSYQLALALRKEVAALEAAGCKVIQVRLAVYRYNQNYYYEYNKRISISASLFVFQSRLHLDQLASITFHFCRCSIRLRLNQLALITFHVLVLGTRDVRIIPGPVQPQGARFAFR